MFPFKRSNELLETVENQKKQLARYESRLRDLVVAYKSLQKEKEALEASVKVLNSSSSLGRNKAHFGSTSKLSVASHNSSRRSSVEGNSCQQEVAEDNCTQDVESYTENADNEDGKDDDETDEQDKDESGQKQNYADVTMRDDEFDRLHHQISTLTASLATVTEEKSKIVATYQAEKKKLKQDTDAQVKELSDEVDALTAKNLEMEEEVIQAKEKIRSQQEDREQEQSTHSLMLREIQKMLNDERMKTERLSTDLQEAKRSVQKAESDSKKSEGHEKQMKKLVMEIEMVNEKLSAAKDEAKKPQPIVGKLQKEMAELKATHRIQLEKAHMQFIDSEDRLKKIEEEAEERVSLLENQILQLSNQLGGYETGKTRDQMLTRTLKERISQLEAENGILAKQVASSSHRQLSDIDGTDENELDIELLKQHIVKYKGLLKNAGQKTGEMIDVEGWIAGLYGKIDDDDDYQKMYLESKQELQQLREEFDKYKIRAQNVLKTKRESTIHSDSAALIATQQQFQELKDELAEVRERHFHLRSHCDGLEEHQKKLIKNHDEELMKQHLDNEKHMQTIKESYATKILDLEQEMRSQRERTVALLAEKDKEIQHLKAYSNACHKEYQSEYGGDDHKRQSSTGSEYVFYDSESNSKDSLAEIMNQGTGHDTTMIHYAEQMARKDVSINGLRRQKKQLELQIRQLQETIMTKDGKYSREVATLEETLANFNRTKSRANANLEYLKNVMFQYLTTDKDQSARTRMLSAVTTILQFSPDETKKVMQK